MSMGKVMCVFGSAGLAFCRLYADRWVQKPLAKPLTPENQTILSLGTLQNNSMILKMGIAKRVYL